MKYRYCYVMCSVPVPMPGSTMPFETREEAVAFHDSSAEARATYDITDEKVRHYLIDHETGQCEKLD